MTGSAFTVTGVGDAITFLKHKQEKVVSGMVHGLERIGLFMEREVKASIAGRRAEPASVDTGRYMNSVTSTVSTDLATRQMQAVVYTEIDYAKFLEYGTSKFSARAHFQNSLSRNRKEIQSMMKQEVANVGG